MAAWIFRLIVRGQFSDGPKRQDKGSGESQQHHFFGCVAGFTVTCSRRPMPNVDDISVREGLAAPASTPRIVIEKIYRDIVGSHADSMVIERLEKVGIGARLLPRLNTC